MGLCQVHHVRCVSRQPFKVSNLHHRPHHATINTLIIGTLVVIPRAFTLFKKFLHSGFLDPKLPLPPTILDQVIVKHKSWTITQRSASTNAKPLPLEYLLATTQRHQSPKPLLLIKGPLPSTHKIPQQHESHHTTPSHRLQRTRQTTRRTALIPTQRPTRAFNALKRSTHSIRMRRLHTARSSMKGRAPTNKII